MTYLIVLGWPLVLLSLLCNLVLDVALMHGKLLAGRRAHKDKKKQQQVSAESWPRQASQEKQSLLRSTATKTEPDPPSTRAAASARVQEAGEEIESQTGVTP